MVIFLSGSKEGEKIKYLVEKGQIVPTEITVSLLLKAIKSNKKKKNYIIIILLWQKNLFVYTKMFLDIYVYIYYFDYYLTWKKAS